MPDLLEQMTWAINAGGTVKPIIMEFLSNIGKAINVTPAAPVATIGPVGPTAPDLLPLMQQIAWAVGAPPPKPINLDLFLETIAYYLIFTGANQSGGNFRKPTGPPMPSSLESLVGLDEIPRLMQVAFWLINEGGRGNQKAWGFLQSLGVRLNKTIVTIAPGPYRFPKGT